MTVLDEGQSTPDVGECEGHIGGGCEKNVGHVVCPFKTGGVHPLNCFNNTTLSGEVNLFIVKSLQTVCLLCALVGVVFPRRHTSIVPEKSPFVSGIIVPGCLCARDPFGYLWGASVTLSTRKQLTNR